MPDLKPNHSVHSILVTGGSGYLASHIIQRLLSQYPQADIHIVDLRPPKGPFNSNSRIHFHPGSITSHVELLQIFQTVRPSIIFHTAALVPSTARSTSQNNASAYHRINVAGTEHVLSAAITSGSVLAFVHTSSVAAISPPWRHLRGATEDQPYPRQPFGLYHGSKAQAEQAVLASSRRSDEKDAKTTTVPACALRLGVLFGGRDDPGIIPLFYQLAQSGVVRRIRIGSEDSLWDWLDVESAAHAHILAAEALLRRSAEVSGQAFYITSCEPVRFGDFVAAVRGRFGFTQEAGAWRLTIPIMFLWVVLSIIEILAPLWGGQLACVANEMVESSLDRWFDCSKAERLLEYRPVSNLQESVDTACASYLDSLRPK